MVRTPPPSLKHPGVLFLSFFGVGFVPKAPGTAGSLAALPLLYLLNAYPPSLPVFVFCLVGLILLTCMVAQSVQKQYALHDPSWIVMDEVIGMLILWPFLTFESKIEPIGAFFLFRLFDIFKPWPASRLDRLSHGAGTVLDDVACGLYAGGVCWGMKKILDLGLF